MNKSKLIYKLGMRRSKQQIIQKYGVNFYKDFSRISQEIITKVTAKMPDIGNTIFSFNYEFAPTYIAWYKASKELELSNEETEKMLWLVNERLISIIPKSLMRLFIRSYLTIMRTKAKKHEKLMQENKLHPYDWIIKYREINEATFEIDIYECGIIKLAKDFAALEIVPAVCRVDYMLSNYMGAGFVDRK